MKIKIYLVDSLVPIFTKKLHNWLDEYLVTEVSARDRAKIELYSVGKDYTQDEELEKMGCKIVDQGEIDEGLWLGPKGSEEIYFSDVVGSQGNECCLILLKDKKKDSFFIKITEKEIQMIRELPEEILEELFQDFLKDEILWNKK